MISWGLMVGKLCSWDGGSTQRSWDFPLGLKHAEPTEMLMSWLENPHLWWLNGGFHGDLMGDLVGSNIKEKGKVEDLTFF